MTHFDIFTIRQWREGYTLSVKIARPNNAPRYKHTTADSKRAVAYSKKNMELADKTFATLDDVFAEVNRLQFPAEVAP